MPKTNPPESTEPQPNGAAEHNAVYQTARIILLAWIGAFSFAQEEIEHLITRLVERGEIADHDARRLLDELFEGRKRDTQAAEAELTKPLSGLNDGVPFTTKADISALDEEITRLISQIDDLQKP